MAPPAAARTWLNSARPVYEAGTVFTKDPLPTLALALGPGLGLGLGQAYDVLVHLTQVREARSSEALRCIPGRRRTITLAAVASGRAGWLRNPRPGPRRTVAAGWPNYRQ
ncbi:hypothetical protein [Streptomyces sp. ISL-36]|uniref:hypothetical protein n=1 Tax=Streptomyces sp. ISL-36 TaxID=2819182 RepID=UPI0027E3FCDE|nr:hypothetical protein [Streptomyces sp. ISL-36]